MREVCTSKVESINTERRPSAMKQANEQAQEAKASMQVKDDVEKRGKDIFIR